MAVERISLAELEIFKLDEEIRGLEQSHSDDVPGKNDVDPNEVQAILDSLPEFNEEYVRSEMKRTGASAEDVIAKYLAMIDIIVETGKLPNLD